MTSMTKHTLVDCFSLRARIGWQGLRSDEFKTEGPYLVTGVDFHNGRVDWDDCYHVTEERYAQDKGIQLHEHDLLITKDGTIGKTAVVVDCPEKATLNSGVFVVRAINNEVVPEFLHYVLHSHRFDLFVRNVLTGSTIKHLNQEKFYKFSFEAPDVPTQKKIVEVLESIDAVIDKTREFITKYTNIKSGMLHDLFETHLEGQKTRPLGEISNIQRGGSPRPIQDFITDSEDGINWILPKKIEELERSNPNHIDIEQLKKLKTACIISSGGANEYQHLKQYTNESENELIIDGFKAPFGETGLKGGDGNYGILIVTAMLLTGFDAPVEQVMYLDKKLTNHNLLQAITRVNRTCGANKKCGYLVDYVGITNHLKDALADYADADRDEIMASLRDKSKDIDALNTAYNEIIQFLNEKVGYALSQTSDIIEELCLDEELREEYNGRFSVMSRLFDRVLPNPAALEYSEDYKTLAFIRESVAKMTRNPRFSNKDASKKVRAIIEEYLTVNGVDMEIAPISLLSDDFLKGGQSKKSDRAVSEEIKYAVREFININMPKDPELYARLSERLEQILEEFKNNWAELRKALEQLRRDIKAGRAKENTYGYDATHEKPFLGLLKTEFFGKKTFEELSDEQMSMMKNLTDDVLNRFKQETVAVNFWNNVALQQELRTNIIKLLISPEIKKQVPDIVKRRKDVAQKLMELGYQHFGRND